jgi:methanogenic corrinoid protein MtbC1
MSEQPMSLIERVRTTVSLREPDQVPVGLLALAPVLQEFSGIPPDEYFANPRSMLRAQVAFYRRFSQAVPIAGIRPDYGPSVMASGFGFKLVWLASGPRVDPTSKRIEEIRVADPYRDGLLPQVLEEQRYFLEHTDEDLKEAHGNLLWGSMALGPLQSIAELIGYNQMFARIREDPRWMHEMCEIQTQSAIALVRALEGVFLAEGITPGRFFLADETVGLVSEEHLREFFLPYVQRIYAASRAEVKCFHADEDVTHIPSVLLEMGANLYNFNFSPISRLKRLIGHRMCLEGNIDSVRVLAEGTIQEIEEAVRQAILKAGAGGGYILSTGGGVSTGTPPEHIDALIAAVQKYGRYPLPPEADRYPEAPPPFKPRRAVREPVPQASDLLGNLAHLVANGAVEEVAGMVSRALEAGLTPQQILMEGLGQGMQRTAQLYYRKQSFMPEMVMASAAFQQGLEVLEPHLGEQGSKGRVVIGAVQGNVQESGILVISAMLRGAGFEVYNLGVNVAPERFLEEARAKAAQIVAMGVYTRDRLPSVADTTRLLREKGTGIRTLVGGKAINRELARELGADAYAEDGYEAIERALGLVAS